MYQHFFHFVLTERIAFNVKRFPVCWGILFFNTQYWDHLKWSCGVNKGGFIKMFKDEEEGYLIVLHLILNIEKYEYYLGPNTA